jgi:hypothetical protein
MYRRLKVGIDTRKQQRVPVALVVITWVLIR